MEAKKNRPPLQKPLPSQQILFPPDSAGVFSKITVRFNNSVAGHKNGHSVFLHCTAHSTHRIFESALPGKFGITDKSAPHPSKRSINLFLEWRQSARIYFDST